MNGLATRGNLDIEVSGIVKLFVAVMVMTIMADFALRATRPAVTDTAFAQYIQAQSYMGISDPRNVDVTDVLTYIDLVSGHPYVPWVSANFINDGPDSAKIAINYPAALYELKADESASVYRIGAQERIGAIFFICERGERASLRIIGEY